MSSAKTEDYVEISLLFFKDRGLNNGIAHCLKLHGVHLLFFFDANLLFSGSTPLQKIKITSNLFLMSAFALMSLARMIDR